MLDRWMITNSNSRKKKAIHYQQGISCDVNSFKLIDNWQPKKSTN
jgi:hypothetical protein